MTAFPALRRRLSLIWCWVWQIAVTLAVLTLFAAALGGY
jgi:hypothetical protein